MAWQRRTRTQRESSRSGIVGGGAVLASIVARAILLDDEDGVLLHLGLAIVVMLLVIGIAMATGFTRFAWERRRD